MEKVKRLHEEHLRAPLDSKEARAAVRKLERVRAKLRDAEQKNRELYAATMAVRRAKDRALAEEQAALELVVRGYGRVPIEVDGETVDVCSTGEKLYTIRRPKQ